MLFVSNIMATSAGGRVLRVLARSNLLHHGTAMCCPAHVVTSNQRRLFSSTKLSSSVLGNHPAAQPVIVVFSPSPGYMEEEELDVELIPSSDIKIELTDRAAEVRISVSVGQLEETKIIDIFQQLRQISARERNPNVALRIAVESGGCHGYQYKMELATHQEPND